MRAIQGKYGPLLWAGAVMAGLSGCFQDPDPGSQTQGKANRSQPSLEELMANDPQLRKGYLYGSEPILYRMEDSKMVWQGDIILNPDQVSDLPAAAKSGGTIRRSIVSRWPKGRLPYEIPPDMERLHEPNLRPAIANLQSRTHIRMFKARPIDYHKAVFVPSNTCASEIGRKVSSTPAFQYQNIELAGNCYDQQIAHEIAHTLGVFHEMSRYDRDQYINILWNNIKPGSAYNFYKFGEDPNRPEMNDGMDFGPFDYGSLLMYSRTAFSKDPANLNTIERVDGQALPGAKLLSTGDIRTLRYAYPKKVSSRWRDFGGDGLNDFTYEKYDDISIFVTHSNPGGGLSTGTGMIRPGSVNFDMQYFHSRVGNFAGGDRYADVMQISRTGEIYVRKNIPGSGSTPRTLGESEVWSPPGYNGSAENHDLFYIGDFNGDNKDDLAIYYTDLEGSLANSLQVCLNTGTGFAAAQQFLAPNALGDLARGEHHVGYFNNDKYADFMWTMTDGEIYVALSNGSSFGPVTKWMNKGFGDLKDGGDYLVGNLNGDAMDDLVFIRPVDKLGKVEFKTCLSKGTYFSTGVAWIAAGGFGDRSKGEYRLGRYSATVYKNGVYSGWDDLVYIGEDGKIQTRQSMGTSFAPAKTRVNAGTLGSLLNGDTYH
jgi:astacin